MKTLCASLLLLLLATACDGPQRNRLASTVNTGNGFTQPTGTGGNPWSTGSTNGSTGGGTTGGANTPAKPPGFENCDISAKYYAAGINYIGICQSTIDETSVAVNSTVADSARTCMIPTFKEQDGSSTYLGGPQCYTPQANVVSTGQLSKTRSGNYNGVPFTQKALNGVMIIKEASITAYYKCMDFSANFPGNQCPNGANTSGYCAQMYQQCPNGASTNSYCSQQANYYRTIECNNFKANHPYIDIRLK